MRLLMAAAMIAIVAGCVTTTDGEGNIAVGPDPVMLDRVVDLAEQYAPQVREQIAALARDIDAAQAANDAEEAAARYDALLTVLRRHLGELGLNGLLESAGASP